MTFGGKEGGGFNQLKKGATLEGSAIVPEQSFKDPTLLAQVA